MASQVAMDAVGNLSAVSTYTGAAVSSTTCLLHDAASRLVAVGPAKVLLTTPGGTACQAEADVSSFSFRFEYDAWNRRASRWGAGGGSREFIHDPAGHLLAEMKSRSTTLVTYEPIRDYVWLDGRPLAQLEYPGPPGRAEGYTYYFHLDHLDLPRVLSNEDRVSVWSAIPTRPYGDVAEVTAVDPLTGRVITTELRLPGQYDEKLLAGLGLQGPYYNWHRWYLPTMGRYMELDPIALAGGFNAPFAPSWYAYAEGSPLRYVDPWGLETEVCHRNVQGFGPLVGARHCYVRFDQDPNRTLSYWANRPVDKNPFVTEDLNSRAPAVCKAAKPPEDANGRNTFDACVASKMKTCDLFVYNIKTFNCCDCVADAVWGCGGQFFEWPDQPQPWGPTRPPIRVPRGGK